MRPLATVLLIISVLFVAPLLAEEPAPTAIPPAVPAAPSLAMPPRNTQLLNDVPNPAEVFTHQWSAGVPQDVVAAEQSVEHYGRLLELGAPHPVSLPECIALALQNNTDLEIQRLGPVAAANQVRNARAIFDPVLFGDVLRDRVDTPATTFLTAGGGNTLYTQHFNYDAGLRKTLLSGGQLALSWQNQRLLTNPSVLATLVPQYTTTLGLSLNQPLLRDFGWRHALLLVEVAQNTEQQAYRQYEAGIANIIAQVERAYWALVLAIEDVQVQEHGVALGKEVQRQNEGKFNVGALPQTAVLEAKADVARRESILIQAQNHRDNARDTLRAVINFRDPESAALLLIDPQDKPAVAPYDVNLERSLRTALEQRPELVAARLDIHGKGLLRKNAENQLLPKLNLAGAIGLNGLSGSNANATFPAFVGNPPTAVPIPVPPPHRSSGAMAERSSCCPTAATTTTASVRPSKFRSTTPQPRRAMPRPMSTSINRACRCRSSKRASRWKSRPPSAICNRTSRASTPRASRGNWPRRTCATRKRATRSGWRRPRISLISRTGSPWPRPLRFRH